MFDLESAIVDWRRKMSAGGITSPEVLDELESHLRDEFDARRRSGLEAMQAFVLAVETIGQPRALKKEFLKAGRAIPAWLRRGKEIIFGCGGAAPVLDAFGPGALEALAIAPDEARQFRHDFVGTEHVLLGLIKSSSGIVPTVLRRLGADDECVRKEIQRLVHDGPVVHEIAGEIPFTPRARQALQLAVHEAGLLKCANVGAEHLLLGLLREGSGVASVVLKNLGVDLAAARREILKETGPAQPPTP